MPFTLPDVTGGNGREYLQRTISEPNCFLRAKIIHSKSGVEQMKGPWCLPSGFQVLGMSSLTVPMRWWQAIRESGTSLVVQWLRLHAPNAGACMHACSVMSDSGWPLDCSPPVSSVHGILQARILEWVAIPFPWREIFSTQGSNPSLLHWQVDFLLSHLGRLQCRRPRFNP